MSWTPWQLITLVGLALLFVALCGYSPTCSQNMDKVYMLGSGLVMGAMALARSGGGDKPKGPPP